MKKRVMVQSFSVSRSCYACNPDTLRYLPPTERKGERGFDGHESCLEFAKAKKIRREGVHLTFRLLAE